MMDKEIDDTVKNKKLDKLSMKAFELDSICREIWLTLLAKKRLGFNELHRSLKKLGTDIAKPTLLEHLDHLAKQKLIRRKVEGFQNVSYGITQEIYSLLHVSQEDMEEWLEVIEDLGRLAPIKYDMKEHYKMMTEKQLDQVIDHDLNDALALNLFELKNIIGYDLKIDTHESDADFWKFIGNPMYRIYESIIAERCRESDEYKKKLFEKMETLIDELKTHRLLGKS